MKLSSLSLMLCNPAHPAQSLLILLYILALPRYTPITAKFIVRPGTGLCAAP
jgi:hypothetical protein